MSRLIVFDCDSTLSAIEGVDELGALRGDEVKRAVEDLTNQAMAGEIPIAEVFPGRMELIRPTRQECEQIGAQYIERVEPTAAAVVKELQASGWTVVILSGGFAPVIEPLARFLGIERIEAVPLYFAEDGAYEGFGEDYPTTRNGGKPEIIRQLKAEMQPAATVMVGDGVSDLETQNDVDLFIGFGRYAERAKVKAGAESFVYALDAIPPLLRERF
jgi:phosphoserine phosphatase